MVIPARQMKPPSYNGWLLHAYWFIGLSAAGSSAAAGILSYFHYSKQKIPPGDRSSLFKAEVEFLTRSSLGKNLTGSGSLLNFMSEETQSEDKYQIRILKKLKTFFNIGIEELQGASLHLFPVEHHIEAVVSLLCELEKSIKAFATCVTPSSRDVGVNDTRQKIIGLMKQIFKRYEAVHLLPWVSVIDYDELVSRSLLAASQNRTDLGSSIDKMIEEIEDKLLLMLTACWKTSGFFDMISYKEKFTGHQYTRESIGVNIGTLGASYLFPPSAHTAQEISDAKEASEQLQQPPNSKEIKATDSKPSESAKSPDYEVVKKLTCKSPYPINLSDAHRMTSSLNKHGLVVLRNSFTAEEVADIKSAVFANQRTARDLGKKLIAEDGNVFCHRRTLGRLHCLVRGTTIESPLLHYQALWMPLVFQYLPIFFTRKNSFEIYKSEVSHLLPHLGFEDKRLDAKAKDVMGVEQTAHSEKIEPVAKISPSLQDEGNLEEVGILGGIEARRLFVSEIQTIATDPLAVLQSWHRDNSARGLTIVIPLMKLNSYKENGVFQFLPGSHILKPEARVGLRQKFELFLQFLKLYEGSNGPHSVDLEPGDVLIYDSRLLSRGLSNEDLDMSSCLVFRYDYEDSPPPGGSLLDLRLSMIFGKIMTSLKRLYDFA